MSMCAKWREALREDEGNKRRCVHKRISNQRCTLNSTFCLYMDNNPTCKLSYMILILGVFHSHGTIQSNYRIILCRAQTKSREWSPMAGREAILPAPQHPLQDDNDNILGCLLSACLDPFASPQHSSIHVAWFCLNVLKKTCSYG